MADETKALHVGFFLARCKVEPLKGQIISSDKVRHRVGSKSMDVLVFLASRHGETLSRQAIINEVWGADTASDEALTHCISELRHALGDHSDDPEYLLTIRNHGYRLIGDVASLESERRDDSDDGVVSEQLRDLKKRKVFQALLGYPVLGWVLVQIVDVLWEYLLAPLGAPAWLVPTFVVLVAIGYPIAVFFAWAVDLTPGGIRITEPGKTRKPVLGLVAISAVALAVPTLALFLYFNAHEASDSVEIRTRFPVTPPVRFDKSIAVLRFDNISASAESDYIGDGLTEQLIHELVNLKTIKVAARTAVWQLPLADMAFADIARRLSVEQILEGSVRVEGRNVRVTAQLIDKDGFHLWSQTYDRQLDSVLDIQKEIAEKVVGELDLVMASDVENRLKSRPTDNTDAYDKFLQGRFYLRMPSTHDSLDIAQEYFDAAVLLDNRFPLAFAGLCETHLARYRLTRDTIHFGQAEVACHRALTLDGGLAEVYTALGNLYRHSGQHIKAEQEYLAALRINSTLEEAVFGLGRAYQGQGRLDESEQTLMRNVEIEPGYWGSHMGVGNFLYRQGRYAEAVPYYETVTQLAPDYAGGFINLGSALHWLGDWESADEAFQNALQLDESSMTYQNLGTVRFYQGEFEGAVEYYLHAIDISPSDHRNWGKLAAAQRFVPGQVSEAPTSYKKALELAESQLVVDPDQSDNLYLLSLYRLRTGDLIGSREAIDRSLQLTPESSNSHYFAALIELQVGNREKSLVQLEKAAIFGYSLRLMAADPDLEMLHDDERFIQLVNGNN